MQSDVTASPRVVEAWHHRSTYKREGNWESDLRLSFLTQGAPVIDLALVVSCVQINKIQIHWDKKNSNNKKTEAQQGIVDVQIESDEMYVFYEFVSKELCNYRHFRV